MVGYLSDAWMHELDTAAKASERLRTAVAGVQLTVQQVIKDGPDGDVTFHLDIADGDVSVAQGVAADPDVTFTQDHATAVAIGRGELSAQAAFMAGRLRVGGNVALLMEQQRAFSGIDDVFADVRGRTSYPPD
jgi:putative sterol carrier protein